MKRQISTLGYALLGLLARGSYSGYDLAQMMKFPIGRYWSAQRSQIYPELARLQKRGLVTHQRVEQEDRPDKKVYTITDEGCEALRDWVTEPAVVAPGRDEMVLKVFSIWLSDQEQAIALFRDAEQTHARQLEIYEEQTVTLERSLGDTLFQATAPEFGNWATLQRGIGYEREYVAWCRLIIDTLERRRAASG